MLVGSGLRQFQLESDWWRHSRSQILQHLSSSCSHLHPPRLPAASSYWLSSCL